MTIKSNTKRKPQSDAADGVCDSRSSGQGNDNGGAKEPNNNKRAKEEDPKNVDGSVSHSTHTTRPAPKYGTKEYWEARYKSHLPNVNAIPQNAKADKGSVASESNMKDGTVEKYENTNENETSYVLDGVVLSKESTKPGHEWYFSYEELRPIVLPLILGNIDDNEIEEDYDEDAESWVEEDEEDGDDDGEGDENGAEERGDDDDTSEHGEEQDGGDDEDKSEHDSENDSDSGENKEQPDEETAHPKHESQQPKSGNKNSQDETKDEEDQSDPLVEEFDPATHRPKRVLEVGCGDMPLGTSLVSDLVSMQSDTGANSLSVVEEVTCIDYSEIVVNSLIENQKREQQQDQSTIAKDDTQQQAPKNASKLYPTFQALDARSLPFSSNTYDLILEKGTLDAMLSDEEEGVKNCVLIVKEMARVTSEGGAILIVSHLNANEPKGMGWLQDVVFRGLKDEFLERHQNKAGEAKGAGAPEEDDDEKEYVWCVEVHGGGGQYLVANGDEIEGEADDEAVLIYGPAVYVIRKKVVPASIARELYGNKEKGASAEGENTTEDGTEQDTGEDGMVMPPVKLEFLTYDG
eukprot:CAMPEP_0201650762 /NCGR_PEP_ID=MMETSP0493-20130528/41805_1 /ASSEMBLY_ACC=CAM_ASM_000838 /TAXON_ID=420259 /ORGANISM="Thalassiosira gravida, Strain GMp14c1" /LENGTH=576 /DNA_ID=CAMNT_0048126931 /DNA_START=92 /DNA_END=1825 /DNA_ORIENTATION=-